MKHPLEFDDSLYSIDSPNLIVSNCMYKIVEKRHLEKYFNQEGEEIKNASYELDEIAC